MPVTRRSLASCQGHSSVAHYWRRVLLWQVAVGEAPLDTSFHAGLVQSETK